MGKRRWWTTRDGKPVVIRCACGGHRSSKEGKPIIEFYGSRRQRCGACGRVFLFDPTTDTVELIGRSARLLVKVRERHYARRWSEEQSAWVLTCDVEGCGTEIGTDRLKLGVALLRQHLAGHGDGAPPAPNRRMDAW